MPAEASVERNVGVRLLADKRQCGAVRYTVPDEFLYFPFVPVSVRTALAVPLSKLKSRR